MLNIYIDKEPLVKKQLPEMISVFPGLDDGAEEREKITDKGMINFCSMFGEGTKSYMQRVNQCIFMSYKGIPLPKSSLVNTETLKRDTFL